MLGGWGHVAYCVYPPSPPMPRVLTDSTQQATLASGRAQVFITGSSFNTKEQLMEGFKITKHFSLVT